MSHPTDTRKALEAARRDIAWWEAEQASAADHSTGARMAARAGLADARDALAAAVAAHDAAKSAHTFAPPPTIYQAVSAILDGQPAPVTRFD